jgi:membrane protein required for colicin V production
MQDFLQEFLDTGKWLWIDYTLAGAMLFSAFVGLLRGLLREVFALATWIAASWVGMSYCHDLSPLLATKISLPAASIAIAFAALFFATLLLGGLISFLLSQLLHKTGLTLGDRLLGLVFGFIRGAVLISILVILAGLTPLPQDAWWKQSRLLPPFQSLALWLKDRMPSSLTGYINYR